MRRLAIPVALAAAILAAAPARAEPMRVEVHNYGTTRISYVIGQKSGDLDAQGMGFSEETNTPVSVTVQRDGKIVCQGPVRYVMVAGVFPSCATTIAPGDATAGKCMMSLVNSNQTPCMLQIYVMDP